MAAGSGNTLNQIMFLTLAEFQDKFPEQNHGTRNIIASRQSQILM